MKPHASRFVRLCYFPRSEGHLTNGIPLIVFEDGQRLRVVIRRGWDRELSGTEREYLSELISDWQNASGGEPEAILDQLAEASVGPICALESGVADEARRGHLIRQVESGTADHGQTSR